MASQNGPSACHHLGPNVGPRHPDAPEVGAVSDAGVGLCDLGSTSAALCAGKAATAGVAHTLTVPEGAGGIRRSSTGGDLVAEGVVQEARYAAPCAPQQRRAGGGRAHFGGRDSSHERSRERILRSGGEYPQRGFLVITVRHSANPGSRSSLTGGRDLRAMSPTSKGCPRCIPSAPSQRRHPP